MTVIERSVLVDAPRQRVWEAIADIGGIQTWNPGVPRSYSTSEAAGGVGATRHCDLATPGASLEERVTDWIEGRSYTIEIFAGKRIPPFREAHGTISLEEKGHQTLVTARMRYTMKLGVLGALMNGLIVRSQFGSAFAGMVAGLKHHVETGEEVSDKTPLDLRDVATVSV